jgi:CheY-like chemotaxis protein
VSKTLLAVDDSATMRKVLEITFSSEDYRVITADSSQAALAKLTEQPKVYVIDTVLGGDDGYALSKEIRKRDAAAAIVLLSSRHNPFDPAKGKDAGADDFMDKPFDTQQMLDKVRKVVHGRETGVAPAAQPTAPPAAAARPAPAPVVPLEPAPVSQSDTYTGVGPGVVPAPTPAPGPAAARPAAGRPVVAPAARPAPTPAAAFAAKAPAARPGSSTLAGPEAAPSPSPYAAPAKAPAAAVARPVGVAGGTTQPSPQPPKVAPHVAPVAHAPAAVAHAAPAAAPAASAAVASKVAGHLAGKLGDLGLTPAQVDAVLALSREVVERVVWDVVPELAETLIKEEIARLMNP